MSGHVNGFEAVRYCRCGCGASLDRMRVGAVYHSPACRMRAKRAEKANKARTEHPLAEARAEQEASKLNDHLAQIVYNAIIDRLKVAGDCHADDLEDYFPDEHRDRCRKLVPGQLGSLRGRKFIQPTAEYRKSKVPARKCAKSWVYIFTEKGRATLVGASAESAREPGPMPDVAPDHRISDRCTGSGENGAGVSESVRPEEVTSVDLESASTASPEPETLSLLPRPPSMFDPDQRAA